LKADNFIQNFFNHAYPGKKAAVFKNGQLVFLLTNCVKQGGCPVRLFMGSGLPKAEARHGRPCSSGAMLLSV
jgi:hypothetical protein